MEGSVKNIHADFVIVGGGLAGICAAVSAARHGLSVVLCQDRAILGGNSSSECRVWACGATAMGFNRYAEESGIINELCLENLYRNKDGNPFLWDALLLETVLAEPGITLLLNTRLTSACSRDAHIENINCFQFSSETTYHISAPYFADCTGDAALARYVNAETVYGTQDIDESVAPQFLMDDGTYSLGDSLLFYVKKQPFPVKYIPPAFAYPRDMVEDYLNKTGEAIRSDFCGCDYWWLEVGGQNHIIADSEDIAQTLRALVFGIWDYIKNSGKFEADNMTLEWVGSIPARRESYRVIAQHVLTHIDILEHPRMSDAVCHGGWPIDTHPINGFFDNRKSCRQQPVNPYDIPLRSLCCAQFENLLLAGRNAGMTHLAMASARVQKTCALMGQAIGTAAALSIKCSTPPSNFRQQEIYRLQETLARDDVWIIGRKHSDPHDVARNMSISGTSGIDFFTGEPEQYLPLNQTANILLTSFPVGACIHLWLHSAESTTIEISVYDSIQPEQYLPNTLRDTRQVTLCQGDNCICIPLEGQFTGNVVLQMPPCAGVDLGIASSPFPGALGVWGEDARGMDLFTPAVRVSGIPTIFAPEQVIDGYNRPYGGMHLWAAKLEMGGAFIELSSREPVHISQLHLFLDCGLYRDYNHLRPGAYHDKWTLPHENLAKHIEVECFDLYNNLVRNIVIKENRQRHIVCLIEQGSVVHVRVTVRETWGGKYAEIHEIRLYDNLGEE